MTHGSDKSTQQYIDIKELARRSDLRGVVQITGHLLLAGVCVWLLSSAEVFWQRGFWTLVSGVLLVFLFAPLHETIHKTAFHSMWLNRLVSRLCGFVIFLPPTYFRSFHMAHHRYTQIPGKDPELAAAKPGSMREYLVYLSGFIYFKEQVRMLVSYALGSRRDPFVSDTKYAKVVREARVYLALYLAVLLVSLVLKSPWALYFWIIPVVVGQPVLRGFLLAEHTLCPEIPDMMENTRTTKCRRPLRWLCWNMNYHVEHHAYPAIPFHSLPAAHLQIRDQISHFANSYLDAHKQIASSLR